MNPQQYKESREVLYEKAHKLYQLSTRGEDGEKETATRMYEDFILKNDLDRSIVLNIEKFKSIVPHKTFKFDGMEFLTFEEFKNWFELNKDKMSFFKRLRLMSKLK